MDRFLDAASQLLAIPSTVDRPDELHRAVEFVVDFVGPGFTVERFSSAGTPSALLYKGGVRPHFRLILNAHLDVVPASPGQFRPYRRGGRLYARGAQDMKVSALAQARVFRELAGTVPYPLALQLVADEEVGGLDGTHHQLEQGVTGAFVLIGEQSGLDLVTDSKGLLHVVLRADTMPPILDTVTRLMARYPTPTEEVWRTTVSVARLDGTTSGAEAWLDIRYPAEDPDLGDSTADEALTFIRTFCVPAVALDLDEHDPPHHAAHDGAEVTALRYAALAQGYPAAFVRKHGGSDAGFYSRRGIDAVAFGVGGDGQHGPDEYVDLATVAPYHRALSDFVAHLAPQVTAPKHPPRTIRP